MPNKNYYAGFFDGEGSVSISTVGTVQVAIAQREPFILYKFKEEYGGEVYKKTRKFSDGYNWRLCGKEKVGKFLEDIFPYSIVKKDDIRLGLEVNSLIRTENKGCNPLSSEEYNKRMKLRAELLLKRSPKKRGVNLQSHERIYRDSIKEQFDYKCSNCGINLKDKSFFWQIVSDGKLFCRTCNKRRYSFVLKPISKETIIEAIKTTSSLDEAAKKLDIARSSLLKKRKIFGLEMKRVTNKQ